MPPIEPFPGEGPVEFVERAETLKVEQDEISSILKSHFGLIEDGDIKHTKLQSKVFWDQFYRKRINELRDRGGARYAAINFVRRKNGHAEDRRKLTEMEIAELVDSVGEWER